MTLDLPEGLIRVMKRRAVEEWVMMVEMWWKLLEERYGAGQSSSVQIVVARNIPSNVLQRLVHFCLNALSSFCKAESMTILVNSRQAMIASLPKGLSHC